MVNSLAGMTVQTFLHRYFPAVYLLLTALLGSVAGWLVAVLLGFWMVPPIDGAVSVPTAQQKVVSMTPLSDYQVILDRNIFDPNAASAPVLSDNDAAAAVSSSSDTQQNSSAAAHTNFTLIGTVAAGTHSLAVLQAGKETHVYGLGEEIADGVSIEDIARNTVVLVSRDGSRQTLTMAEDQGKAGTGTASPSKRSGLPNSSGIKQVGENRFIIPREVAEQARSNVNELMKQARMEPRITDGRTDGFIVRMIRPRSFLSQLGLRPGDVIMAINDVQLDSPEKALQIFQQLREARNIKLDLLRHNQPLTLDFETN